MARLNKREPHPGQALLSVQNLIVRKPDGTTLLDGITLNLLPGEVTVLLGPSGAGKSTFGRVLLDPGGLRRDGFSIKNLPTVRGSLGFVPQRGALFDHLDIHGNIDLAIRYSDDPRGADSPAKWLKRVDLDESLAEPGVSVSHLSGGQAQRVAVARTLAGGRNILFLDEPSVGLDPARIRLLANQLRQQIETTNSAAIVVTHDLAFALGVADRLFLLDPRTARFEQMFVGKWPGPFDSPSSAKLSDDRGVWMSLLEEEVVSNLQATVDRKGSKKRKPIYFKGTREAIANALRPFFVASSSLFEGLWQLLSRPADFWEIFKRTFLQAFLRPMLFYSVVSVLLGYTVLFVIARAAPNGILPALAIKQIGSGHIIGLVPPLGAFLFVAASGNAVNGWLGGMGLTKQIAALEALGISRRRYLWGPASLGLFVSFLLVAVVLALGMLAGGFWYCDANNIPGGWALLTTDLHFGFPSLFGEIRPERIPSIVRAACLLLMYAAGIACDVVAAGSSNKEESDHVTRGMTGSVVRCTLWVVSLELATAMILPDEAPGGRQ